MKGYSIKAITIICFLTIALAVTLGISISDGKSVETKEIHDTIYMSKPISDWELLTLAIMEVESRYDIAAFNSSSNATGIFQITPVYVEEFNRISNKNYTMYDCYDLDRSIEMWDTMNQYHNPELDIDKAINLHNPTAGEWYRNAIFDAMDDIEIRVEIYNRVRDFYNAQNQAY